MVTQVYHKFPEGKGSQVIYWKELQTKWNYRLKKKPATKVQYLLSSTHSNDWLIEFLNLLSFLLATPLTLSLHSVLPYPETPFLNSAIILTFLSVSPISPTKELSSGSLWAVFTHNVHCARRMEGEIGNICFWHPYLNTHTDFLPKGSWVGAI